MAETKALRVQGTAGPSVVWSSTALPPAHPSTWRGPRFPDARVQMEQSETLGSSWDPAAGAGRGKERAGAGRRGGQKGAGAGIPVVWSQDSPREDTL